MDLMGTYRPHRQLRHRRRQCQYYHRHRLHRYLNSQMHLMGMGRLRQLLHHHHHQDLRCLQAYRRQCQCTLMHPLGMHHQHLDIHRCHRQYQHCLQYRHHRCR